MSIFIKRKHPINGEKKKKQGTKFRQANNPKEASHKEERETLRTRTLHQAVA
jgi:hypothetical protein